MALNDFRLGGGHCRQALTRDEEPRIADAILDDLSDIYTFECRSCGVSHTEPALSGLKLDAIQDDRLSERSVI